jgi:hypothetical protein
VRARGARLHPRAIDARLSRGVRRHRVSDSRHDVAGASSRNDSGCFVRAWGGGGGLTRSPDEPRRLVQIQRKEPLERVRHVHLQRRLERVERHDRTGVHAQRKDTRAQPEVCERRVAGSIGRGPSAAQQFYRTCALRDVTRREVSPGRTEVISTWRMGNDGGSAAADGPDIANVVTIPSAEGSEWRHSCAPIRAPAFVLHQRCMRRAVTVVILPVLSSPPP